MIRRPLFRRYRRHRRGRIDDSVVAAAENILRNMEPVRRDALVVHRIEGMTYTEFGARLSLSRTNVFDAISAAVAELANGLASHAPSRDGHSDA